MRHSLACEPDDPCITPRSRADAPDRRAPARRAFTTRMAIRPCCARLRAAWPSPRATSSRTIASLPRSAPAAWARSTAPPTRSSGATWRSRCCRPSVAPTPSASPASSARRSCSPRSTTRTSPTSTASRARLSPDGSPAHFLAMELVPGEDLAERLKRGPIPVDEALAFARQVAEALEEAHEKGIVHRDLKPANVKLTPDGKVKVLDFGLAKAFSGDAASGSSAGSLAVPDARAHRHPGRPHPRHRRLHVARAGARPRGRQARRHLGLRRACSSRC